MTYQKKSDKSFPVPLLVEERGTTACSGGEVGVLVIVF